MKPLKIEFASYNIYEAYKMCEDALIRKCIEDNPYLFMHEIVSLLGVSKDFLQPRLKKLNIQFRRVNVKTKTRVNVISKATEQELEKIPKFK